MSILTDEEKDRQSLVPTTVEEAYQILDRNQDLLGRLDGSREARVTIKKGCPHCSGTCTGCAWAVGQSHYYMACLRATFGGIKLYDLTLLTYWDDSAELNFPVLCRLNWGEAEIEAEIADVRRFLEGHIEWAMIVIAAGGVPWPEGVEHG